ncbi:glycerophosphodiester phosphodiesterase family protein [Sphingosinicella soli]|uniref:Glycerophosphoryl diester phosphodiesterase n=1 Tax=Sphingosinicella soli TaxID=333708 RepID=A0A7W7B2G8_9SPHN|nr:glycerophosphodiester phosphodiesterase family protein [Sphingosinicella soli]MBB4631893.1 glycerophosphoryl diester phosphodiesterase [Sphingosinicella soli]
MRNTPRDLDFLTRQPFAHRGLHGVQGAPENSGAAFARAIDAGFGIELDVRLTADKDAVVFHDAELPRLVNAGGRIADLTVGELGAFRLSGTDEPIRTLREVLSEIGGRTPTLVEVKSPGRRGCGSLCRAVRRALEGANGWAAVMSFDPRIVRWFREHSPQTVRGLVVTKEGSRNAGVRGWLSRHLAVRSTRPHFLAFDINALPCSFAERQRRKGRPVLTWTVQGEALRARARANADQIIFEGTPEPA